MSTTKRSADGSSGGTGSTAAGSSTSGSTKKKRPRYSAERVIGSGSFGVVYKAVSLDSGEVVAIKKVREDKRYKNRELSIMKVIQHPNIVTLRDCFYSRISRDIFLNLVMEFIPETIYGTIRNHAKARQTIPFIFIKLYLYQMCRALSYCHTRGICHRDIKPQNLLLDPATHTVKLCDFGSAKELKEGEPSVAYICSRYYRAPELIFEASYYKHYIDIWSIGCVAGELFLTVPLFQGERSVDQLVEIIKVLGSPSPEEVKAMNPHYTTTRFPAVQPLAWRLVFKSVSYAGEPVPETAIDLISQLLRFIPHSRLDPFDALAHEYFDELRDPKLKVPGSGTVPALFNFTTDELLLAKSKRLLHVVVPRHLWASMGIVDKSSTTTSSASTPDDHATGFLTGSGSSDRGFVAGSSSTSSAAGIRRGR